MFQCNCPIKHITIYHRPTLHLLAFIYLTCMLQMAVCMVEMYIHKVRPGMMAVLTHVNVLMPLPVDTDVLRSELKSFRP